MKRSSVVVILLGVLVLGAYCDGLVDGNRLYQQWLAYNRVLSSSDAAAVSDAMAFVSYLQGVVDTLAHINTVQSKKFLFVPRGTSTQQLCQVVGNWLAAHPKEWNQSAAQIAFEALSETYRP